MKEERVINNIDIRVIGNVDSESGRIYIGNDWCSFEAIEEMYKKIKPLLRKRQKQGLIEGQQESK